MPNSPDQACDNRCPDTAVFFGKRGQQVSAKKVIVRIDEIKAGVNICVAKAGSNLPKPVTTARRATKPNQSTG